MATQSLLTPESVQLIGGLDFVTPRPSVAPGSLLDCLNFEVADRLGYKTIDGIERFDGSISSSKVCTNLYTLVVTSTIPSLSIAPGSYIWDKTLDRSHSFGVIVSSSTIDTDKYAINFIASNYSELSTISVKLAMGTTINFLFEAIEGSSGVVTLVALDEYSTANAAGGIVGTTTITSVQDSISAVNAQNALCEAVKTASTSFDYYPGTTIPNPVIGMHWFKERLYTINDLDSIYFSNGSFEILPNDIISFPALTPTFRVRGIVVSSGSWQAGTAAGKILFTYENGTAQPKNVTIDPAPLGNAIAVTRGAVSNSSAALVATSATAVDTWYAGMSYAQNEQDLLNLPQLSGSADLTSNRQGFQNIELGYNFSFTDGTSSGPPSIVVRDAQPTYTSKTYTTAVTPGAVISYNGVTSSSYSTGVGLVYQGTSAVTAVATANDSSYVYPTSTNVSPPTAPASSSGTSNTTTFASFPIPAIATGSLIVDALVNINCFENSAAHVNSYKLAVQLTVDGTNFSAVKTTGIISSTSATATDSFTLGGPGDPWAIPGATPENISNVKALVGVMPVGTPSGINQLIYIDYISLSVSYQKNVGTYFFNNGVDDVTAVITNVYLDTSAGGDWSTNNAAGSMQVIDVSPALLSPPSGVASSTSTTGGTGLAANTAYYYVVTALGTVGETTVSSETSVTTGAGTTNKNTVTWVSSGGTGYTIYRGLTSGGESEHQTVGAVTTFSDTGTGWTAGAPPVTNTATNTIRQIITAGDKIYTSSNKSGNLIGTVSTTMEFSGLPTQKQIKATNSQYEIIDADFYGNTDWTALYGVSGAGRPWTYDGNYFRYIYTGLPVDKDKPRHVAFFNFHLVLGYDTGANFTSVAGNPEDFSGVNGAGEFDTGDSVTGLLRLNGTSLGIFCKNSIHILNGTDNTNFSLSVFNPYEGAIEYTIIDCGRPVWTSSSGICTLEQSAAYGNFAGARLSSDIAPWLLPRITKDNIYSPILSGMAATYTTLIPNSRAPLFAIPVRNKNQYRLAFADGYWLTMTLQGQQLDPSFTIQYIQTQRATGTLGEVETKILIPLAHTSSSDSNGKSRNFVSWDDSAMKLVGLSPYFNTDSLYVWELDRGWGFGSQTPVNAWFTTTHNFFDNPFQMMTIRDIRLHGLSYGLGNLSVAVSADYLSNDFSNGNMFGQMQTNAPTQDISLPRDGGLNPYKYRSGDLQPQTNIAAVGKTGRSFSFQFSTPQNSYSTLQKLCPPVAAQQLLFQLSSGKADIK